MKISIYSFALITIALVFSFTVSANSEADLVMPISGLYHTSDSYIVIFDKEGDAIVNSRFAINNATEKLLNKITLELPKGSQLFRAVLEPSAYTMVAGAEKNRTQYITYTSTEAADTTIYTLNLPWDLAAWDNAEVIMLYKVPRLAQKDSLGNYSFTFQSVIDQAGSGVNYVKVAIGTDKDFILKGGAANADYSLEMYELNAAELALSDLDSSLYNNYSQNLSSVKAPMVVTKNNLGAFEKYEISGSYGGNALMLYIPEIVILAAVLIVVFLLLRKFRNFLISGIGAIRRRGLVFSGVGDFKLSVIVGFIAGLLINIFWYLYPFFLEYIQSLPYSNEKELLLLNMIIFGFLVSGFLLLAPAAYFGKQRGVVTGILIVGATIISWWIIISLYLLLKTLFFPAAPPISSSFLL